MSRKVIRSLNRSFEKLFHALHVDIQDPQDEAKIPGLQLGRLIKTCSN